MCEVIFLGTGGAFAAGRRSNLALLIRAGETQILVESGPTIVQQLACVGVDPEDIDALFVSHAHGDHTLGFPMLNLSRIRSSTHLDVYTGPSTRMTLEMLWTLVYADFGSHYLRTDWHPLSEYGPAECEVESGITLFTNVVPHPPGVPTLAARWELPNGASIGFVTDTIVNPNAVELVKGCSLLIHEASYSANLQPDTDASRHYHSTARQAGEVARKAGCERLALVHLGLTIGERPDVLIEEAQADTSLPVIIPEDGMVLELC